MTEKNTTLFGFPVVVTDAAAALKDKIIFGHWPTPEEIRQHGSFENAINAQKRRWAMITGLNKEPSDDAE